MPTGRAYTSPQQRRKRLLLVLLAVIILFGGRIVMMRTGMLQSIVELQPEALRERILRSEANVRQGTRAGTGTIVDVRKTSVKDEAYTCTMVTAAHVVSSEEEIAVTLQSGDIYPAELAGLDAQRDVAVLRFYLPDEKVENAHEADRLEVLFSRDALARISAEDAVYCVNADGALLRGMYLTGDVAVDGIGEHMLAVRCENENGMSGGGVYDVSGDYLGMIVAGTEDGTVACVPAADVMRFYDQYKPN